MKSLRFATIFLSTVALLAACGDSTSQGNDSLVQGEDSLTQGDDAVQIENKFVEGVSQKGPFVTGSSVKLYELNGEDLRQTGKSFTGKITSDKGEFSIKSVSLASPYALLEANGYYRNEVTGKKSIGTITLSALTDLSDREKVNINLLTHLEYERALYLASEGMSVPEAKKQAESEIFGVFGIEGDFGESEDLSIFNNGEGDAALLAFSVLMLGNLSDAELTERLTKFATDVSEDGEWNDEKAKAEISDWASDIDLGGRLSRIRDNIEGWKLGSIPKFEKYVRNFWYMNYGLEDCDKNSEGVVQAVSNKKSSLYGTEDRFICKSGSWVLAGNLEKDTYQWRPGKDGEVKAGDVTGSEKYVYEEKDEAWRPVGNLESELGGCTQIISESQEKVLVEYKSRWYVCVDKWAEISNEIADTLGWDAGDDGSLKQANRGTENWYKYDESRGGWLVADDYDVELGIGCTKNRAGEMVGYPNSLKSAERFICKSGTWTVASDLEKDTYQWKPGKDGEMKPGDVVATNIYVYDEKTELWHVASELEVQFGACVASVATDTEKNILGLSGTWYICKNNKWEKTDIITVDTQSWGRAEDGSLKRGERASKNWYKYDERLDRWVAADDNDTDLGYDGCTKKRTDEMVGEDTTYYICSNSKWHRASATEFDTHGKTCSSDNAGQVVEGTIVNTNKYYCVSNKWNSLMEDWTWRFPKEAYINPEIDYGTMTDSRDGKTYRTVKIGGQVWMAENLNYNYNEKSAKSWCYDDNSAYCEITGRLYSWAAAVDSGALANDADDPQICGNAAVCTRLTAETLAERPVQGVCPEGWHLPSAAEWEILIAYVGDSVSVEKLKSSAGWNPLENSLMSSTSNGVSVVYAKGSNTNGIDSYGFSILPAGCRWVDVPSSWTWVIQDTEPYYTEVGKMAAFWTSTQKESHPFDVYVNQTSKRFSLNEIKVMHADHCYSVRCIKD